MTAFATTQWSLVARVGLGAEEARGEALEILCRNYWTPAYEFVRRAGFDEESAKDLTQEFFAKVLEKNSLALADQDRGRFRTFLLTMLKRFLSDSRDHGNRLKRGGGVVHVSLDGEDAPHVACGAKTPDEIFDHLWAMNLMERVAGLLRQEAKDVGKEPLFLALAPYLSSEGNTDSQAHIGEAFAMSRGAVAMAVHRLRARFRELVRREVSDTLVNAEDLEAEMTALREALRT